MMLKNILLLAAIAAALPGPVQSQVQDYPSKPIRLIAPAAPGLSIDILARVIGAELGKVLNQSVVVENRPGAGGEIGTNEAVKAAPDGYTLLFASSSVLAGNKWLYPRTFDQERDLVPIIIVSDGPLALVTGSLFKGKSLHEVLSMAKAAKKPYALGAAATVNAVAYGLLRDTTGIDLMLVPYRSNGQAFVELMKGDIQLMIEALTSANSLIRDGRILALAVTSAQRSKALPDVPTLRESGMDVVITGWSVLVGPRGIPEAIVQTLNRAGNVVLSNPELRAKLTTELKGGTSEEAAQLIQKDSAKWGRMIEKFNLKL